MNKESGRKRKGKAEATAKGDKGDKDEGDVSDDDQFAFLGRSVLKRASHVSDAEDSDDDSQ